MGLCPGPAEESAAAQEHKIETMKKQKIATRTKNSSRLSQ
jgi:hypothetical protein